MTVQSPLNAYSSSMTKEEPFVFCRGEVCGEVWLSQVLGVWSFQRSFEACFLGDVGR